VIARGAPVYKVDERPVPLIYGTVPLYRVLVEGVSGTDVRELEQNLAALGYSGLTVDDSFTAATAAAVRQWQADLGVDQAGAVDLNQVVVAASRLRVATVRASVGDAATGPVLSWTGTTRSTWRWMWPNSRRSTRACPRP
jgi:peptidoglycan hydrolase-like protein with peptidoglycan-binding domain